MRNAPALALLAVLGSLAPAPFAAPQVGGLHRNERFGFALKPPRKWTQIPIQAGEDWLVGKWMSNKTYFWTEKKGGWTWEHKPQLMVIAFVHRVTEGDGGEVAGEGEGGERTSPFGDGNPYEDYEDYLERTYSGGGWFVEERERKKHKKLDVTQLQIKVEKLATTGPKRIITWVYHLEGVDIAVQFEVLESAYPKLKSTVKTTLKSFKEIPRNDRGLPTEAGTSFWITVSDMDSGTPSERRRMRMESERQYQKKILDDLPEDWTSKKHGRVFVVSHVDGKYDKKVAAQVEAILDWLDSTFPFVGPDEYVRTPVVRICKNWEEERSYSQGRQAGGGSWFVTGTEIVTHKDEDGLIGWGIDSVNREVLALWFRDRDRELYWAMPSWLSHGLNEYVESLRLKGRRLQFRPDWWDKDGLREVVREGRATRPRDLIRMTSSAFQEKAVWDRMREAGALVHFFLSGKASRDSRTRDFLPNYLRDLKDVTEELKKEGEGLGAEGGAAKKPKTEEEEEEMYRTRREVWRKKEQRVIDEVARRSMGGWTDREWDHFERVYFESID